METYSASDTSVTLSQLVNRIALDHKPICIKGNGNNAILLTEEDYSAIQETIYLMSIPGMHESILEGRSEKNCSTELPW